jgi:hypothetical protein
MISSASLGTSSKVIPPLPTGFPKVSSSSQPSASSETGTKSIAIVGITSPEPEPPTSPVLKRTIGAVTPNGAAGSTMQHAASVPSPNSMSAAAVSGRHSTSSVRIQGSSATIFQVTVAKSQKREDSGVSRRVGPSTSPTRPSVTGRPPNSSSE